MTTPSVGAGVAVLRLPTYVQGHHLLALRRQLIEALEQHRELVLDCSEVLVLSVGGQLLLRGAARSARRRGGGLLLDRPTPAMVGAVRSARLAALPTRRHPRRLGTG